MKRLTLIFMIDALGYEQAGGGEFLPQLTVPRAPIQTVLGYSSACIPTIMTGKPPGEHGQMSMYRRAAPGQSVFGPPARVISMLRRLTQRGDWRMRQAIAHYLRWRGITGYFALYDVPLEWLHHFDLCQRKNIYRPDAFERVTGLPDVVREREDARIWDWSDQEESSFEELEQEIRAGEKRFLLHYTADLDALMHVVGPDGGAAHRKLEFYHEKIGRLIRMAEDVYDEVQFYVFGDHGMAPVEGTHNLWAELDGLKLRVPEDYLFFLDSTMARFWFHTPEARTRVTELLRRHESGRILDATELTALGSKFDEDEYGEMIFLLDEGHIFVPSFMGKEAVKGMHGYHPDARASYTTLLSNRPNFEYPRNLFELHEVLRDAAEWAVS